MLNGKDLVYANESLIETSASLDKVSAELETVTGQIADAEDAIESAKYLWMEAADNFKTGTRDLITSIELLDTALTTLTDFYKKPMKPGESFAQQEPEFAEAPEGFEAADEQKPASENVLDLLARIKNDAAKEMDGFVQSFNDAEMQYSDETRSQQQVLEIAHKRKDELEGQHGSLSLEKTEGHEALEDATNAKAQGEAALETVQQTCAFILEHFDTIQAAKSEERESYLEAINYLSGMQ